MMPEKEARRRERKQRAIGRRTRRLRVAAAKHPLKPAMPKGTYWDEDLYRYVSPDDAAWTLERYEHITGDLELRPTQPEPKTPSAPKGRKKVAKIAVAKKAARKKVAKTVRKTVAKKTTKKTAGKKKTPAKRKSAKR